MGCWNEDRCDTLDYRTAVIQQIIKDKHYSFGVIAGDNIYQQRGVYHMKTLDYGFGLLQQTNVPLYTLLGNHDVHKKDILKAHLKLVQQKKIIMPRHCYTVEYPNMRMIVLDTNLLTSKVAHDETYTQLLKDYPNFFTVPTAADLLGYIASELRKPFKGWTLVIGHEPLLSVKTNTTGRIKVSHLNHFDKLMTLLSTSPRTVYLCADVHAFQAMNIPIATRSSSSSNSSSSSSSNTVPMVVAGTGGAYPDRSIDEHINIPIPGTTSFFQLEGTSPSYGYVSVSYSPRKLRIRFHPLKGCSDGQSDMTFEYKNGKLVMIQCIPVKSKTCPALPAGASLCPVQRKNT